MLESFQDFLFKFTFKLPSDFVVLDILEARASKDFQNPKIVELEHSKLSPSIERRKIVETILKLCHDRCRMCLFRDIVENPPEKQRIDSRRGETRGFSRQNAKSFPSRKTFRPREGVRVGSSLVRVLILISLSIRRLMK